MNVMIKLFVIISRFVFSYDNLEKHFLIDPVHVIMHFFVTKKLDLIVCLFVFFSFFLLFDYSGSLYIDIHIFRSQNKKRNCSFVFFWLFVIGTVENTVAY